MTRRPPKARDRDVADELTGVGDAVVGAQKGRGAVSNPGGRYEPTRRVGFSDGWDSAARRDAVTGELDDDPPPRADTIVSHEQTRTIIATNDSPDLPFAQSVNPYKGCEHGCIYCFARPTHAYLGLSPGLDFETRITAKPDAAAALRKELARPGYQCRVLAMGTNTDPYQPVERTLGITRSILEVLAAHDHPVGIVTKSASVVRDVDLLAPMAAKGLVHVCLSITSLDPALAAVMEPRASRPVRRLEALRRLADAGVPVGVLASPMIPAINDGELEQILEAARAAGATTAGWILVRLPLEVRELFSDWLAAHFPDRAARVLDLIRQTRGGALYDASWGQRMTGAGPYAELIARRFAVACARLGFDRPDDDGRYELDTTRFKRPAADPRQLPLFR